MKKNLDPRRVIFALMQWSKVFVPVIALLAALASSIRTVQTTAEIYTESGSAPVAVIIAALAFTMSVEGALFLLALAQENQHIKWRQSRKRRSVTTLRTIGEGIAVRVGLREPLAYDQIPESDSGLQTLILIAFLFAIASNMYLGLRPILEQMGTASLQSFLGQLLNAKASLQLTFIVDLAGVFFPPFMALKAGHLTARFASEVAGSQNRLIGVKSEPARQAAARMPKQRSIGVQKTAIERVNEWLNEHPESAQMSQRQIADAAGVSVGTVNGALKSRQSVD